MRSAPFAAAFVLAVAFAGPRDARAYDQKVHVLLSERGFGGDAAVGGDAAADAHAVALLRDRIWHAGGEAHDPELRRRFLLRWPRREAFDAWAMKYLFALNPDKRVAGFDDDVALPAGSDARAVYATASRLPDDDQRNRDRFRHVRREVQYDHYARPLPDDPATLEMGSLTGLSSQAHAHYGLPHLAFSDDPAVLKSDPRRFAIPPTVHTFGADFAESYTILALLASRVPGGQRLALTQAGAAAHHLEDVANQIHTVQVGIYDFFVDAKLQSIKEELLSVGGLLRPRPSFVSIGIDIISNHHVLAESLFAKHLLTPNDPVGAQTAAAPPDAAFQHALDAIAPACTSGFGRAIAEALIDRSSYEGPEVYRAIRSIAQRRWSRAGEHFGDHDDPDAAIKPNARVDGFYALEAAGARRATQTLAAWWARYRACAALDDAAVDVLAETLVRERLDALDSADARARAYTPKPPEQQTRTWWVPALYVFVLLVIVLLVVRRARRGARSESSPDRAPPRG